MASMNVVAFKRPDSETTEEGRIAADIVRKIRAGDTVAETALVERYSKGLRFLLLRRTRDEERAQDLLHDTFYIAITKLREGDIESPERVAGYLRGIAVRVAMNAGRRQRREPYAMDVEAVAQIPDREPRQFEHVARKQTRAAVHKLLKSMTVERDREILTRFYVEDEDKEEICRVLGLDSLHFNRVLFRAKKRFRKLLEESASVADLSAGKDDGP